MRQYHKIVQDAILKFGNLHMRNEVVSISRGGEKLRIAHRTKSIDPITFKPDRVFTLRDRTKIAFQVLGSQAQKGREIEADIFRAFLSSGVSKLIFIVSSAADANNVSRISEIVQDALESLGATNDPHLILTLLIPKNVRGSEAALVYLNGPKVVNEIFRKITIRTGRKRLRRVTGTVLQSKP